MSPSCSPVRMYVPNPFKNDLFPQVMSSPRSLCCHGILPAFATTWLTRYLPQPWTGSRTQRQQKELVRLQYLRLSEGRGPWTRSSQRRLVDYADSLRRLPRRALASELDLHGRDLDGKLRRRARRRNDFPRLMREAGETISGFLDFLLNYSWISEIFGFFILDF